MLLWFILLPDSVHQSLSSINLFNANTRSRLRTRITTSDHDTTTTTTTTEISSIACLGLTLQMTMMYLGTIAQRTIDPYPNMSFEWLPPQLSAVHYVLRDSFAIRDTFLVEWIRQQPFWMTQGMTAHAMIAESSPLIWFLCPNNNNSIRYGGFIILSTLHLGLLAVTRLPNWQFMGIAASVLWIPTSVWDNHHGRNRKSSASDNQSYNDYKKRDDPTTTTTTTPRNVALMNTKPPIRTTTLRKILSGFFLGYMAYNFCGQRGWISKHDGGDIGEFLRISQYWVMYAQPPKHAVVTNIVGYTSYLLPGDDDDDDDDDMDTIDVMQGLKTGEWNGIGMPQGAPPHEEEDDGSTSQLVSLLSHRWERALDQWGRRGDTKRAHYWKDCADIMFPYRFFD
jgi:hypothetical protein